MSLKEKIENTEYEVLEENEEEVVLIDSEGKKELWAKRPDGHAGYAIILEDGLSLEFVRSL